MTCIMPKPFSSIARTESHRAWDSPNTTNPAPNIAAEKAIVRVSPRTDFRIASTAADPKAPNPFAAVSSPNVCAPPCSTCVENIGSNVRNGSPRKLHAANSSKMVRTGRNPETYAQPSAICFATDSFAPVRGFIASTCMATSDAITAT